jgi:Uma2 family endonuclease
MPTDRFDRMLEDLSEPKLELIDGRLAVGNGSSNLQLLRHLLEGWGAEAAVPMAPAALWWEALERGFERFQPPRSSKPASVWQAWAGQLSYAPELLQAGPMLDGTHRGAREALMMGLFGIAREHRFAHVSGRDVIMRLGEDAFTPDVFAVGPERSNLLNRHYLDGPADLAIEVLLRGHEDRDRQFKRQRYGVGGVREYWLVDPVHKVVECLLWDGHVYRPHFVGTDGTHRSAVFPGLAFLPQKLWEHDGWGHGPNPFCLESPLPAVARGYGKGGVAWGDLDFDPRPGLTSRPLSFEEFASWAPEAKYELMDGKPWVGGSRGSRNVVGLLLRTEGLAKTVTVLHPREWIAALARAEEERATDAERRAHWWQVAREAAGLLRARFGLSGLTVIGDLLREQPLDLWSMITLVASDLPDRHDTWEAAQFLYEKYRDEPDIDLIRYEHATRSERQAVGRGVEV